MKDKIKYHFQRSLKSFLTLLLTANLLLVSTGSADINFATDSSKMASASAEQTQPASASSQPSDTIPTLLFPTPGQIQESDKIDKSLYISPEQRGEILKDSSGKFVADEIIVTFKRGKSRADHEKVVKEKDTKIAVDVPDEDWKVLKVAPTKRDEVLNQLKSDPNVESANLNIIYKSALWGFGGGPASSAVNDPYFPYQQNLQKISAESAWNLEKGSYSVYVAVIDSGVTSSVDLSGRLILPGWNFFNENSDTTDVTGHGTAIASIIAANTNNGQMMAGIDWRAKILPIRITDSQGNSTNDRIRRALAYARTFSNVKVANLSVGDGTADTDLYNEFVTWVDQGRVIVVSAGYAATGETAPYCPIKYPASYPGAISVTATNYFDQWSSGCGNMNITYPGGQENIRISAPGENINGLTTTGNISSNWTGTSFAAPHVAAAASLLFSCTSVYANVKNSIKNGVDDIGQAGFDYPTGYGRLNLRKALEYYCY